MTMESFKMELMTDSPEMMQEIAARMVMVLGKGAVLGMIGPLGAGKTTFVQRCGERLAVD